jgi:hypothetical protein
MLPTDHELDQLRQPSEVDREPSDCQPRAPRQERARLSLPACGEVFRRHVLKAAAVGHGEA